MPSHTWNKNSPFLRATVVFAVLALIAAIYWPVIGAGFVSDDHLYLHDAAALRQGNHWILIFLHGFADWATYFRPLGVALFAIEVHAFDVVPAPMHLVSLGLHLLNVLLVGVLARRLLRVAPNPTRSYVLPLIVMLLFGLHPALVEPVAWISSQYELLVVFFMLLGLILNLTLPHVAIRAATVALCFFLAACAKESALSFPFLLLILDWVWPANGEQPVKARSALFALLKRQWPVYLCVLAAGIGYLVFRWWGLGFLVSPYRHPPVVLGPQLQTVCFTYLTYWKLLLWPMNGLAPLHIVPAEQFAALDAALLATDIGALLILSGGLYLLWNRSPFGGLIMGVSAALLPVIHIIPVVFDENLYHERYAMLAIAIACSLLPSVLLELVSARTISRTAIALAAFACAAWLMLGLMNLRVTLPLWSDDVRLWQWALLKNPGSIQAERNLLAAYIERNDLARAQPLATVLMREGRSCTDCMLNVVVLALSVGDAERASIALREAKKDMDGIPPVPAFILDYMLYSGLLSELEHDPAQAEEAYRSAIAFDSSNPRGHMALAYLLAHEGRKDEARAAAETALPLYATDERVRIKRQFEQILDDPDTRVPPGVRARPQ